MNQEDFGLYIHIPFCKKKCPYCDFNTYALGEIPEKEYVLALKSELKNASLNPIWQNKTVSTIYFGGGTPSIFSKDSINEILSSISQFFKLKSSLEITLEANPGDLDFEDLKALRKTSINRLSFGVQSLNDSHLKTLGRWHKRDDAIRIFNFAREADFNNISLDLMFSLPNQTIDDLDEDLNLYLKLNPEHISTYELTLEKGTPFFSRFKKESSPLPSEDLNHKMYTLIIDKLTTNNFDWYEVSNFGKKGFYSKHNTAYWKGVNYLGIGAGAHSFYRIKTKTFRLANIANVNDYLKSAKENKYTAWSEELSNNEQLSELITLGFRTKFGVKISSLEEHLEISKLNATLNEYLSKKLLEIKDNTIYTTRKGRYLADSLASAIIEKLN